MIEIGPNLMQLIGGFMAGLFGCIALWIVMRG